MAIRSKAMEVKNRLKGKVSAKRFLRFVTTFAFYASE